MSNKNNDDGGLLQEYDLSGKILDSFHTLELIESDENYLEFRQKSHILGKDYHTCYFYWTLIGHYDREHKTEPWFL